MAGILQRCENAFDVGDRRGVGELMEDRALSATIAHLNFLCVVIVGASVPPAAHGSPPNDVGETAIVLLNLDRAGLCAPDNAAEQR